MTTLRRSLWAASTLALLVAAVVLCAVRDGSAAEQSHLPLVASCAVVGGLIAVHRPGNPVGRLLLVSASAFALMEACGQWALAGLPGAAVAAWPQTFLWVPANLALVLVPFFFPAGEVPARRRPIHAAVAVGAVTMALAAFAPGENGQVGGERQMPNPFGVAAAEAPAALAAAVTGAMLPLLFAVGAGTVIARARRARGDGARPFKWLAYAVALALLAVLARLTAGLTDGAPGLWPTGLGWEILGAAGMSAVPAALGIAILRHGLFDIDLLINRTLVYTVLTACVVGGYVAVVGYLGALFAASLPVSLAATGLVALVFAPLRDLVQRSVNRLLYGRRDDPYAVLVGLGRSLERTAAPDAVPATAARTLAETLRLPYAAVELDSGAVAALGTPGARTVELPLVYRDATLGRLLVSPRPGERGLSAADRRILADLAPQIAVALHLQRARERLVLAREEERRRLRRDLHDGLGPELAALTMRAEAVAASVPPGPAVALLEEIVEGTQTALGEVRRLVDGLRPPALDTLGLLGALRSFTGSAPGPRTVLHAPGTLPDLPAAVEVAAYRIATEALTNARRHADAARCELTVAVADGRLSVLVTDDGRGLPADAVPGVGLASMRERAAELGGTLTLTSGPGAGTRVRADLPLEG
ncbi:sensor histidine kinase [Actinomadura flavalba]|uniref:sensor histidine kinase n=1 Tax=Actinomadura flavalba TaxID=1120938 RepID=UPI0003671732|nr:sensor histidine kinase [Actinomadura flavalba]